MVELQELLRIDIDDGKYTFVQAATGGSYVLRYGEPWIENLPAGANCWLAMAYELEAALASIATLHQYNARLREALAFYADETAWNQPPIKTHEGLFSVEYENSASKVRWDRGRIARTALQEGEGQP